MREQLKQYVDLLFAGTPDAADMKQEILQNTLDRYDDLIAQGKTPQAAYQLAISGIGDINELLGSGSNPTPPADPPKAPEKKTSAGTDAGARLAKAVAIVLFILSAIPLILLEDNLGVCICLGMVGIGVALLVFFGKEEPEETQPKKKESHGILWTVATIVFLVFSFSTGAWYITWVIFPLAGCIAGVLDSISDLSRSPVAAIVRIVLWVILFFVLAGLLAAAFFGVNIINYISDDDYTPGTVESSGSVDASQIKNIQVEWVSGSILVEPSNVQNICFSETEGLSDEDKLVWRLEGNTLKIEFCQPKGFLSFGFDSTDVKKDLVIQVPESWFCNNLDINSVSATLSINRLSANEILLTNVSGKCEFTDCVIKDVNVETVSGTVSYTGTLNSLDLQTVSADCTASLTNHPEAIRLEGVSGDLTLVLPEDCGFTASVDSVSGKFSSELPTTTRDGEYVYGDGACSIELEGVSGSIRIEAA